jgi:hypothetical protein
MGTLYGFLTQDTSRLKKEVAKGIDENAYHKGE